MTRRRTLLCLCAVLGACGGREPDAEGFEAEPIADIAPERVPLPGPPPIYDADGNLLPSTESIAGVVLPVSLEPLVAEARRHVYRTDAPLTRVLRYFGPRLVTGRVDPGSGGGATYRDALARDAPTSTVHLDVAIAPIPGGTRIEIEEILPAPPTPPTEQEALEELARRMRQGE